MQSYYEYFVGDVDSDTTTRMTKKLSIYGEVEAVEEKKQPKKKLEKSQQVYFQQAMSNLISNEHIAGVGIIGFPDGAIWVQKKLAIRPEEGPTIVARFEAPPERGETIHCGGIRYIALECDEKVRNGMGMW